MAGHDAPTPDNHEQTPPQSRGIVGWLEDNVAKPFVGGTGVLQIASNFTEKPVQWQAPASSNKLEWGVQTLAGAAGAILTYVPAGKATEGVLSSLGRGTDQALIAAGKAEGLSSGAARLLSNQSVGQVLGAGLYESLKKPNDGETRSGNALGTMAGFAMFELGNRSLLPTLGNAAEFTGTKQFLSKQLGDVAAKGVGATALGAGRYLVGGIGGLTSYDVSHAANALFTGTENTANREGRLDALAQGGFVNFGLPIAQRVATTAIDKTVNSAEWGRGIPVGRQLGYSGFDHPELLKLANENPLARVKTATDGITRADVKSDTVFMAEGDGPGRMAHELTHLNLARQIEPKYRDIADLIPTNRALAKDKFYQLRSFTESAARVAEARVNRATGNSEGTTFDTTRSISDQTAGNGHRYGDIWTEDWNNFKRDTSYRPRIEFEADAGEQKPDQSSLRFFGSPAKLGSNIVTEGTKGTNFAVYAPDVTALDLLLYENADSHDPSQRLPMFKSGDVWHRFVPDVGDGSLYLLQADGPYDPASGKRVNKNMVLIDPYSKAVTDDTEGPLGYDNSDPNDPNRHMKMGTESNIDKMPKSVVVDSKSFDWGSEVRPNASLDDTIILELNLRGFTSKDSSLPESVRGTYAGLAAKAPWLKKLGVTAVQLMPIMEFDADDWGKINPLTGEKLKNSWGYNTVAFQAPENNYSASGRYGQQVNEFKTMVKSLHDQGIEVILDIVLNHSREGGAYGPTIEFKGLSNEQSYMLNPNDKSQYVNHSGTGNTVNTNHPAMQRYILDTLHYWADEMHVDGFRFDLGSAFKFDADGQHKYKTPIIEAIENDPVLSKLKLIAEPWTAGTAYDRGSFSDKIWMEQDGKFRDSVRKFVKGDEGQVGDLIQHIKGSPDLFDRSQGRRPNSFVVYHDGMTSRDLVMYNEKKNIENGENNTDGDDSNNSWNVGFEGPVKDSNLPESEKQRIEDMRMQLMKNKMVLLLMSQGVPTIYYQDLFGQSNDGNNNIWAQQNRNVLNWDLANESNEFHEFIRYLVQLRKEHGIGRYQPETINFHGAEPGKPDYGHYSRFIGFTYPNTAKGQNVSVYANGWWGPIKFTLPDAHNKLVADTNIPLVPGKYGDDAFSTQRSNIDNVYTLRDRAFGIFVADPEQK